MPRGTSFGEVITMFREETGRATSAALGQNELPAIKGRLRRVYRWLHADYDWPHLHIRRDKVINPGERYISLPTDLDFERVMPVVEVKDASDGLWYPLTYGITAANYNFIDSDQGERDDWPRAWQVYENDQIEIWPIPATEHTLRFRGMSRPKPLVDENEVLDLDDDLVVLYAVQRQLLRDKSADAQDYSRMAAAHYLTLKGRESKGPPVNLAGARDRNSGRQRYPNIQIDFAERYD